jgi:hypothetical protein
MLQMLDWSSARGLSCHGLDFRAAMVVRFCISAYICAPTGRSFTSRDSGVWPWGWGTWRRNPQSWTAAELGTARARQIDGPHWRNFRGCVTLSPGCFAHHFLRPGLCRYQIHSYRARDMAGKIIWSYFLRTKYPTSDVCNRICLALVAKPQDQTG